LIRLSIPKYSGSSQDIALGVLFFLSGLTKFRPLPFLFGGREIEDDDVTSTSELFVFFLYISQSGMDL
jgi:hypothetical protein